MSGLAKKGWEKTRKNTQNMAEIGRLGGKAGKGKIKTKKTAKSD